MFGHNIVIPVFCRGHEQEAASAWAARYAGQRIPARRRVCRPARADALIHSRGPTHQHWYSSVGAVAALEPPADFACCVTAV